MKPLDLDDPNQAREFLNALMLDASPVVGAVREDGTKIDFASLSDTEATDVAMEIAEKMGILRPKNTKH